MSLIFRGKFRGLFNDEALMIDLNAAWSWETILTIIIIISIVLKVAFNPNYVAVQTREDLNTPYSDN